MGKCVSNKIGHPFSFGLDVVIKLWQDIITHFLVNLESFGRFSPKLKVLADVIANIMVDVVTIYLILWQDVIAIWIM